MGSAASRLIATGAVAALALGAAGGLAPAKLALPPRPAGSVRFYLVRHGEAFSNLAHPPPGRTGEELDHLTDKGHAQAREAGRALREMPVDLIVTSPMMRATETAREIAALLPAPVPIEEHQRLRSLKLGHGRDGRRLTWDEREEEWKAGRDPSPPHGESLAELAVRVNDLVQELARKGRAGGPADIVVVTHSEIVEGVLGLAQKRLPLHGTVAGVHNASITVVDVDGSGAYRVVVKDRLAGQ